MGIAEWLNRLGVFFHILPNEPLWSVKDSLPKIINDNGYVVRISPPEVKQFIKPPIVQLRKTLFETMVIKKDFLDRANRRVDLMFKNQRRYQAVSGAFSNPIRWFHVSLIHELEFQFQYGSIKSRRTDDKNILILNGFKNKNMDIFPEKVVDVQLYDVCL